MSTPMRIPAGFTQDNPGQPLANMGAPDPFFLNTFQTDFNTLGSEWVVQGTGGANISLLPGDGGIAMLTTPATAAAGNFVWAQAGVGSFGKPVRGKRMFFAARITTNLVATNAVYAGAILNGTVTAWPTTPLDGIYFNLQAGILSCQCVSNGAVTGSVTTPNAVSRFSNSTYFDVGFEVTSKGEVQVFVGTDLFGSRPQSGTGSQPTPPFAGGPVARFTPTSLPTAGLMSPTLAVETTTAVNPTLLTDFVLLAKER